MRSVVVLFVMVAALLGAVFVVTTAVSEAAMTASAAVAPEKRAGVACSEPCTPSVDAGVPVDTNQF
jgi:hypothetical protein